MQHGALLQVPKGSVRSDHLINHLWPATELGLPKCHNLRGVRMQVACQDLITRASRVRSRVAVEVAKARTVKDGTAKREHCLAMARRGQEAAAEALYSGGSDAVIRHAMDQLLSMRAAQLDRGQYRPSMKLFDKLPTLPIEAVFREAGCSSVRQGVDLQATVPVLTSAYSAFIT